MATIKYNVDIDRRVAIRDVCDITGYNFATVQRDITDQLNIIIVSTGWIPRLPVDEQRQNRFVTSRKLNHIKCESDVAFCLPSGSARKPNT